MLEIKRAHLNTIIPGQGGARGLGPWNRFDIKKVTGRHVLCKDRCVGNKHREMGVQHVRNK